jgi:hypothetical protein
VYCVILYLRYLLTDQCPQRAFEIAFNKLKTARGFWYSFRFDRSPAEMLAKLLVSFGVLKAGDGVAYDIWARQFEPNAA